MKFLFLTAALVHCASASDSPRPPSNDRHARTQGCGNALAAQLLDEQYELHRSRNPQKEAQPYKAPDAKYLNADPFAGGLDPEEKDTDLTLVACDLCENCPKTPNKEDPSQLQYDLSKDCRSCYNPKTGQNNHYVEAGHERTIRKSLVYNMSVMVRTILEVDHLCSTEETTRILCKEVGAETLNYICNYLEMVNGRTPKPITKPIRTKEIVQCVHEHDRADGEWIEGVYTDPEVDGKRVVFDIMLAANSMDIQPLLHLGACKIATLIKGESPEEIKRILGDESDVVRGAVNDAAADLRRRRLNNLFGSF